GFCLIELILDGRGVAVDYLFLETNTAFEAQTGLQHAVGKTILELVPDVSRAWFQRYGRVAQTGESDRFEHHDPALSRWFDVYANRVGSPDLRQVAVVFKDISERKRIEVERERLLESESEARRQAEEASHLKDEFLATVSHELRTPLNAMLGWVHLLRSGTLAPDKRERALETVERNARAQAKLIEDLLDVSRILAGKLGLQIEPLAMHALVEAALETVRPAAEAKNIVLQPVLAMGGVVMGDAHRLQQVVWNLLSNAVKFTPRGGQIRVHVAARDSSVELIVADTGQGIASEFLPHVFERFRQQDGGTARVHGGLGLGLSIVRQLVELHGGTVSVYSAGIGRGASFTVRLPLALARGQEASSSAALQQALLTNALRCPAELAELDVLVVDDEHDAREMLRAMLETCGARVRVATSVSEAVRAFEAAPPALLVSDIGMPEADGYVLIEKVRKLGPDAGGRVPAIALTAYARSEDRTRALLSGFDSHVAKPIEPLELLAVIASLTGVHHERS
ncbi:MAG: domain S-box protein, partial [Myxococcaceae bacterium]|nr:domain S-box protein [Myxococcaceae bacterium]